MNLLEKLWNLISILRRKLIHQLALSYIGKDASPNDAAPDELGCAESVTEILKKAGTMDYVSISTYRLYKFFVGSPHWKEVAYPQPGDVILSPTAYSNKRPVPFVGHVGIVGKNNLVMSNDSATGMFMTNYTIKTWTARWKKQGGYPVQFWRYYA